VFGFSGVLLWKVREPRVNCGFIVGKMLATGFRVRPRGEGRKEEVRWKEQNDVGKRVWGEVPGNDNGGSRSLHLGLRDDHQKGKYRGPSTPRYALGSG
jgi:hypothetical protein